MRKWARMTGFIFLLATVCYTSFAGGRFEVTNSSLLGTISNGGRKTFEQVPPGSEIITYEVTRINGGVIFQGIAVPAGNAIGQPVVIAYNPARQDGRRLKLTIGGTSVTAELYDWEMIPTAQFVDSGYAACMTLYDRPVTPEEEEIHELNEDDGIYWANFHPALGDTLIGLNLFFVDAMFINPILMQNTDLIFNAPIKGYHTSWRNEQNVKSALPTQGSLETMQMVLHEQDELESWNSYIYTDYGKEISYFVENNRIVFTGVPFYLFLKNDHASKTVAVPEELNQKINDHYRDICDINPTVYRSAERTAQWAAFFRMVQKEYPQVWQKFMEQIAGIEASPKVKTPRYWLPDTELE
jgi:hypothetical protein